MGQYVVHQQSSAFCHAPSTATWKKSSALATESDQLFCVTVIALHT
jgi:hypothetical protein